MEKLKRTKRLKALASLTDEQLRLFSAVEESVRSVMDFDPNVISINAFELGEQLVCLYRELVHRFFPDDERQEVNEKLLCDLGCTVEAIPISLLAVDEETQKFTDDFAEPFIKEIMDYTDDVDESSAFDWYSGFFILEHPLLNEKVTAKDFCGVSVEPDCWGERPFDFSSLSFRANGRKELDFLLPIPACYADSYYCSIDEDELSFHAGLLFPLRCLRNVYDILDKEGYFEEEEVVPLPEVPTNVA